MMMNAESCSDACDCKWNRLDLNLETLELTFISGVDSTPRSVGIFLSFFILFFYFQLYMVDNHEAQLSSRHRNRSCFGWCFSARCIWISLHQTIYQRQKL